MLDKNISYIKYYLKDKNILPDEEKEIKVTKRRKYFEG